MTISSETAKVVYEGNSSRTEHSFSPIVIQSSDQLEVTKVVSDVATTLSEGATSTTYSVSVSSYPGTGTVTYPASGGTPLAADEYLVIKRKATLLQETDLNNQGGYFPEVQEDTFDLSRIIDIQQQEEIDRTPKFPIQEEDFETELPALSDRASKYLGFDADGNFVALAGDSSVTSTMEDSLTVYGLSSGATSYPTLILQRETASPADDDQLAEIRWVGNDDLGNTATYARIIAISEDVTDATEDGALHFVIKRHGSDVNILELGEGYVANLRSDSATGPNPKLQLNSNIASPGDGDIGGQIDFRGNDSGLTKTSFARIEAVHEDVTDATEDAYLRFIQLRAGAEVTQLSPGVLYTAQASTSGTNITFSSIPTSVNQVIMMLYQVSVNDTGALEIQIGDTNGFDQSNYLGVCASVDDTTTNTVNLTTGFKIQPSAGVAAELLSGQIILNCLDKATNTWVASWNFSSEATNDIMYWGSGSHVLTDPLDRIRILNFGEGSTFDSGLVNVRVS